MSIGDANQAGDSNITSMEILVVDDDELSRRMMQVLLVREGHRVDVAANGLEGFNAVKSKKYDIVLMDLQMPIMDGLEASQKIREWENGGMRTFIVALTASYLPERGQNLFDAGIDNYISKPFEMEHLQRMLKYRANAILAHARIAETSHNEEISVKEIVDFRKGVKRVGGDIETYWELFGDFIQELPKKTAALHQYFALGDLEGLSRAAHNLKGVAANLGVLQLSAYADRLDKQSSEGYTQLIGESLKEINEVGGKLEDLAQIFLSGREVHAK
jgi:CheY-like chemotaxis protein/HPt (histidine-containing phosphotransfer) domain-containing protein